MAQMIEIAFGEPVCPFCETDCFRHSQRVRNHVQMDIDTKVPFVEPHHRLHPSPKERGYYSWQDPLRPHDAHPDYELVLRPYRPHHKPRFREPSHFELVYPKDLVYGEGATRRLKRGRTWKNPTRFSRWTHPISREASLEGKPHPKAGQVIERYRLTRLATLKAHDLIILWDDDGDWMVGEVRPFVDERVEKKAAEKIQHKLDNARRKYLKRPTFWDHLDEDT